MDKPKITIDQLKNYVGIELKVTFDSDEHEHQFVGLNQSNDGVQLISAFGDYGTSSLELTRPLCYRLSDLDKFIPELGFVPLNKIDNYHPFSVLRKDDLFFDPTRYPFTVLQALFSWHFWPFGDEYFDEGLVIDKLKHGKEGSNAH